MLRLVLGSLLSLALVGCSSGGGSGSGGSTGEATKSLSISGSFNSMPSFTLLGIPRFGVGPYADVFKVRCVTLSGPLHAGEGIVDTNAGNAFTVSMTSGLGAALGCFVLKNDMIAAILAFNSSTSATGTGSSYQTGYAPREDSTAVTLGAISVSGAVATVDDPTNIGEDGSAAVASYADLTGEWRVVSIYENAAQGYKHPCDMEGEITDAQMAACRSTWTNGTFFMHMFRATKASNSDRLGFAFWEKKSDYVACGSREGVTVSNGWALDGSYNSESAGVGTAFAAPNINLSSITTAMLAAAPFTKSTFNGANNCPTGDDGTTELPGCTTATTCNSFDFSGMDGTRASQEKVRCITNSLGSGGMTGYNWGTDCAWRAKVDWNVLSNADFKNDGSGCDDASCGGALDWESDPRNRAFISELMVAGNVGTSTSTEEETVNVSGQACDIIRTMGFTVTQKTTTTATVMVEISMVRKPGGQWDEATCMASDWIGASMDKVERIKIDVVKN